MPSPIKVLVPLQGPHAAEGKSLLAAAQLAIDDEQSAGPLPDGHRFTLAVRDESERWGQASTNIVQLIEQDHAAALVTSFSGDIAHQAEQVANKLSIPVLTLSSDPTTTQINIPWIFRLGPSDLDQACAIAPQIMANTPHTRILLIAETDHDGRIGAQSFQKALQQLHAPQIYVLEVESAALAANSWLEQIQAEHPDVVVLWTSSQLASTLLSMVDEIQSHPAVFLSRKASEFLLKDGIESGKGISSGQATLFSERYIQQTGSSPGLGALELYDAVRLLATAIRHSGPNRARLRDYLASGATFNFLASRITFDTAGISSSTSNAPLFSWYQAAGWSRSCPRRP
jgi:ABC-type branched-subunit amino acid transport system substrate-binding protein